VKPPSARPRDNVSASATKITRYAKAPISVSGLMNDQEVVLADFDIAIHASSPSAPAMAVVSLVAISSSSPSARCRGREDDGVAGDAVDVSRAGVTDESVCEGPLSDGVAQAAVRGERRPGGAVANQFDADEVAPTADIAHLLEAGQGRAQ